MRSQSLFPSGYSRWTITGLAVLVFLLVTPAHAQVACKLLQPAELELALKEWALGGKATKFSGSTTNSGGIVLDTCRSEIVRPRGNLQVTVVIVKNHPMDGGDAIRVRNAALAREDRWKAKGAQFEQKTVGKATCILYGKPAVPAHSVCAIPRANGYVEVNVIAPSQKEIPSMDAVGTLAQKANSRW
jgi:hypothetical protein